MKVKIRTARCFFRFATAEIRTLVLKDITIALSTEDAVDFAFNELGYDEISEFLNIHFFKTDFS